MNFAPPWIERVANASEPAQPTPAALALTIRPPASAAHFFSGLDYYRLGPVWIRTWISMGLLTVSIGPVLDRVQLMPWSIPDQYGLLRLNFARRGITMATKLRTTKTACVIL